MSRFFAYLAVIVALAGPAMAQSELRALARVDMSGSSLVASRGGVELTLELTQAVPYRVLLLDAPMRVAVDFREVAFEPQIAELNTDEAVKDVRAGTIRDGWSRLVIELAEPMDVALAGMVTDEVTGSARLDLSLQAVSAEAFGAKAQTLGQVTAFEVAEGAERRAMIVLDPGHGGVDPGAQRQGINEADLMLTFARELREALLRAGRYDVLLTRDDDSFVSLPARVSFARAAGADVFISLHADALAEGRATGTTIYTLSDEASDAASAALAERQDRTDLVAGVDLTAQDDQIATVLMDLARAQTVPRTDRLADALIGGLQGTIGKLHKRPRLEAGFSVLKAPDIPSVLVELGFMSSQSDLERLMDPDWRSKAAAGIVDALDLWALEDAALQAKRP